MLTTRANAMAMLGLGHLVRLKQLNARLLEAYTKSHDPTSSMRSINLPELIAADQQIWDEVFRLARLPEWDVDKALYEVLETSSIADRVLAPRPTISRADTEWIAQRVQKRVRQRDRRASEQKSARLPETRRREK